MEGNGIIDVHGANYMIGPRIALFCCANARAALPRPEANPSPEVSVIELPCSGRIDEVSIIRALRSGAWAVMVVGCLEGNCKYSAGNYQAWRRVEEARSLLQQLGVDPERVQMYNMASNQHARLGQALCEMKERAARLGPIRILEGDR
jgi:coenzyme F420-reducing hydrogenase delta subunit